MSRSPVDPETAPLDDYAAAWRDLAIRIRDGGSFSGHERNAAFLNTGDASGAGGGRFADVAGAFGLDDPGDARALAAGDWDFDGDVDLWLSYRNGARLRYLENRLSQPEGASFLGLRLHGDPARGSNRDAVGARVTVSVRQAGGDRLEQVVTRRAGEGFLSQNSAWLHVGIPAGASLESVSVIWPGGHVPERIDGVRVGAYFDVRQAEGAALFTPPAKGELPVADTAPEPGGGGAIRRRLATPLAFEPIRFRTPAGDVHTVGGAGGEPVLVELWATWCPACAEHLAEIGREATALGAAGVRVLALCIDGLGGAAGEPDGRAARARATELGFPFEVGLADADLVDRLQGAVTEGLYRTRLPLALPGGFLFDGEGRLQVIYRGGADVATVVADVARLDAPPAEALAQSWPFPGRDTGEVFATHPVAVARSLLDGGYPADAREGLERFLAEQSGSAPPAGSPGESAYKARLADVYFTLGTVARIEEKSDEAAGHFQKAIGFRPDLAAAHLALARLYTDLGRTGEAVGVLDGLLRVPALSAEVLEVIARSFEAAGAQARAAGAYRLAIDSNPRLIPALNNLAWLLATSPDDSVRDASEALRLVKFLEGSPARNHPTVLDTAAAAYAESGDFTTALRRATAAKTAAEKSGDRDRAMVIGLRIERYSAGEAWRSR